MTPDTEERGDDFTGYDRWKSTDPTADDERRRGGVITQDCITGRHGDCRTDNCRCVCHRRRR